MVYILFLPFLLLSLFTLYSLSKNDFVLQRKNIILSKIFDRTFIIAIITFIIGRLFYILDSQHYSFFQLISFFHFLKHPGFSVIGVLLGVILGVIITFRDRRIFNRILDIFFLSFIPIYIYSLIIRGYPAYLFFLKFLIPVVFVLVFFALIKFHKNYSVKDGSITLIGVILIALEKVLSHLYQHPKLFFSVFSFSELISIVIVIVAIIILLANEKVLSNKK